MKRKTSYILVLIFGVLSFDQIVKIWIKSNMFLGQEFKVLGDWFIIHFTENNGMAFGIELGYDWGKLALSVFRIVAVFAIAWYLRTLLKKNAPFGYISAIALILTGAVGNIIDSAFYGLIFSESTYRVAEFMPEAGGYAGFLHGKVVDMLYFPLIEGYYPSWFPSWDWLPSWFPQKGDPFIFFRPVFNIADSAITTGVLIILLFQRKYLKSEAK